MRGNGRHHRLVDLHQLRAHSTNAVPWPANGTTTTVDDPFSTAAPQGAVRGVSQFVGEILVDGRYVPPGTRVEAFVGLVRCGLTSTRRTGNFSGYTLDVAGPDSVTGCTPGAPLAFRVDGRPAVPTAPNDIGQLRSPFDLTAR